MNKGKIVSSIHYEFKGKTYRFNIPKGRMVVVGRDSPDGLSILDALLSRKHFALDTELNDKTILMELGALNNTKVNGKELRCNDMILNNGDVIEAGSISFTFHDSAASSLPKNTIPPATAPLKPVLVNTSDLSASSKSPVQQKPTVASVPAANTPTDKKVAPRTQNLINVGLLSFVLGIISLIPCIGLLTGVSAIICGILALEKKPTNKTMPVIGIVFGGLALFASFIVITLFFLVILK